MQNWDKTLLSQYCASPTIRAILEALNSAIDPTDDIANLYSKIRNVYTAEGIGLDIWGQIVNVSRFLEIEISDNYFGFSEAYLPQYEETGPQPFGQAPFYTSNSLTNTYELSDNVYRQLILIKAEANISDLSVPKLNSFLRKFFGNSIDGSPYGIAYVIDTLNQYFIYHFDFIPSKTQLAIIENSGVFPKPAGVKLIVTY